MHYRITTIITLHMRPYLYNLIFKVTIRFFTKVCVYMYCTKMLSHEKIDSWNANLNLTTYNYYDHCISTSAMVPFHPRRNSFEISFHYKDTCILQVIVGTLNDCIFLARSIYRDHQAPICWEKIFLFSIIYTIAHKLHIIWLPVKVYGCTWCLVFMDIISFA